MTLLQRIESWMTIRKLIHTMFCPCISCSYMRYWLRDFRSVCISYFTIKTISETVIPSLSFSLPNQMPCHMDFVRMRILVLKLSTTKKLHRSSAVQVVKHHMTENYKLMSAGKLRSRKYRLADMKAIPRNTALTARF